MNPEYQENKKKIAELVHKRDHGNLSTQEALEIGEQITDLMFRQQELEDKDIEDNFHV